MVASLPGGQFEAAQQPPSPALLSFKPRLTLLSVGYGILLLLCLFSGAFSNFLNYSVVFLAASSMVSRTNECMRQCIYPLLLVAGISLFFDVISVVALLSRDYPGAGYIFSTSCPTDITAILRKNTTIFLKDAKVPGDAAYVVPERTKVALPEDACSTAWMLSNLAMLLGALMDLWATLLAQKMHRVAMSEQVNDGGLFGGLMSGMALQQNNAGQAGGQGEGEGPDGRPLGAPPGAGGPPPGGQGPGTWQAFQGTGQSLGR